MATNYLAEAFQQMKLLESETFSFDNDGAAKLSNFMDDDLLTDVEVVIDPEAETEEDLKDSYIGDIILACEVCHSMIYKREEEVSVKEDSDMANVGEVCPYCYSEDGFKIIGKVAPYEEITVETESGEDVKVEVDGKKIEVETTEETDKDEIEDLDPETEEDKPEDEEDLDESVKNLEKAPLEEAKEPLSVRLKKRLAMKAENLEEEVIEENFYAIVEVDGEERRFPFRDRDAARRYIEYVRNGAPEFEGKKIGSMWTESLDAESKPLKEAMEDISITTETDVIKVKSTPREDKEAIVPMQPEEVQEIIEPEVEETEEIPEKEYVEEPVAEEEAIDTDVEIEEFDEEGFDDLGESYLKKVYENVESYKTTSGKVVNNSIILEGLITFNSGKKAKTSFIFEAKEMTKRGKLKFVGENVNLSKNKKAFTLTGIAEHKKLMCESLTYNYLARDAKNNKARKLYGTIKK